MLKFFNKNALVQYIALVFILLAIRLPLILKGIPLTIPEIKWLALAEAMYIGKVPYIDIWDETSPLTALVYWLTFLLFQKQLIWYHLLNTLLIYIQAIVWNNILLKTKMYEERTLIPALLYIVFANVCFDFLTFSPVIIANTFIILAFRHIFSHINENVVRNQAFDVGFYLGVATMFFLPSFVLLFVPLLGFLIFTGTRAKDYFLLVFAFFIPAIVVFIFFFLIGGEYAFVVNAVGYMFSSKTLGYFSITSGIALFALPSALLLFSFTKLLQTRRYINYQVRCQQVMFLAVIANGLMFLVHPSFSAYSFLIFLPVFSFFTAHYFLLIKKKLIANFIFFICLTGCLILLYGTLWIDLPQRFQKYNYVDYNNLVADEISDYKKEAIANKKILILGNNVTEYYLGQPATHYLSWQLAQRHFQQLDRFNIQVAIYEAFAKDFPEVIIDKKDFIPTLFAAVPALAKKYEKDKKGKFYRLKKY